jgi:hypothetical protein
MIRYALTLLLLLVPLNAFAVPIAPPDLQPGDTYQRIFVTSFDVEVVTSNSFPPSKGVFGSVEGGDWNVNRAAYEAGLNPGWNGLDLPWKAILSDLATNAKDHVNIQGPIYNLNNELIAIDATDFWDGTLLHAILYNELGVAVPEGTRIWTGTNGVGNIAANSANGWTDPSGVAMTGNPFASDFTWVFASSIQSNQLARLYGISPLLTVAPEPSGIALAAMALAGFMRRRRW